MGGEDGHTLGYRGDSVDVKMGVHSFSGSGRSLEDHGQWNGDSYLELV